MQATQLIKDGKPGSALDLYTKHGTPPYQANFNIYKRIGVDLFSAERLDTAESYSTWAALRDLYLGLVESLSEQAKDSAKDFSLLLLISHYYATRAATAPHKQLAEISTKILVSLLRHTDIVPADKAFYEAGYACKAMGWENMAFVFLNRYLDLYEAIEERSLDLLDNSDFTDTDIPFEIPLPDRPYLSPAQHDEVKEWVLAVSMDQRVEQVILAILLLLPCPCPSCSCSCSCSGPSPGRADVLRGLAGGRGHHEPRLYRHWLPCTGQQVLALSLKSSSLIISYSPHSSPSFPLFCLPLKKS